MSAGILSLVPREEENAVNLRHGADMTLHQAKRSGRSRVCEFGVDTPAS